MILFFLALSSLMETDATALQIRSHLSAKVFISTLILCPPLRACGHTWRSAAICIREPVLLRSVPGTDAAGPSSAPGSARPGSSLPGCHLRRQSRPPHAICEALKRKVCCEKDPASVFFLGVLWTGCGSSSLK